MPVLAPIPPAMLKAAFEAAGCRVVAEDPYNWAMAIGNDDPPFMIPKRGKLVSVEIMVSAETFARGTILFQEIQKAVRAHVAPSQP